MSREPADARARSAAGRRAMIARMLDALRAAIDAADWPRALEAALEAWRELRAPELAELVDTIGAHCVVVPLPEGLRHHQGWWIEHASPYAPAAISFLVAQAHVRADESDVTKAAIRARWGDAHPLIAALLAGSPRWFEARSPEHRLNAIDRLAAVLAWPPDPRAAEVLADALETASMEMWGTMLDPVCALVADALIELADPRVVPRLVLLADRDAGGDVDVLTRGRHATRAWGALETGSRAPDPELAALVERVPLARPAGTMPRAPTGEIAALWEQIAAHPDELGPRIVLGDALLERGDPRGELIALQCGAGERAGSPEERARAKHRVRQLVEQLWKCWLGPLAPFLHQRGCELRRGMLEVVRVGRPDSPATGWQEVARHHELCAVHTVRPNHVSPEHYALFIAGLTRPPRRLGIPGPAVVELLATRLGSLPLETVYYAHRRHDGASPALPRIAEAMEVLARLAPALETVAFDAKCERLELDEAVPQLPRWFPRLRRIEIPEAALRGMDRRRRAALLRLPLVVVT